MVDVLANGHILPTASQGNLANNDKEYMRRAEDDGMWTVRGWHSSRLSNGIWPLVKNWNKP